MQINERLKALRNERRKRRQKSLEGLRLRARLPKIVTETRKALRAFGIESRPNANKSSKVKSLRKELLYQKLFCMAAGRAGKMRAALAFGQVAPAYAKSATNSKEPTEQNRPLAPSRTGARFLN